MQKTRSKKLQEMQVICANCEKFPATKDSRFGYLPCTRCQNKTTRKPSPKQELTTDAIKSDRKEFKKDIYQPFRGGEVSKEYLDANGREGIKVTDEEIRSARNLWDDNEYYSD